jgi:hypothetical protein
MTIHRKMFDNNEKEKANSVFNTPTEEWAEGPLKELLVEYVGTKTDTEDVTAEMIVEAMSEEFPEFLMLVAEENWIRGYQQAIHDVDEGHKMLLAHAAEEESNNEAKNDTA